MADRIVVLDKGRIAQSGSPLELYDRPANRFVAEFIGSPAINVFPGEVTGGRLMCRPTKAGSTSAPRAVRQRSVDLGVRPEHMQPVESGGIPGTVQVIEHLGAETYVIVDVAGRDMCWRIAGRPGVAVGDRLRLGFDLSSAHLFNSAIRRQDLTVPVAGRRAKGLLHEDRVRPLRFPQPPHARLLRRHPCSHAEFRSAGCPHRSP